MKSILFVSALILSTSAFAGGSGFGNSGSINKISISVNGNPIEFTPENLEAIKSLAQRGLLIGCPPEDKCTVTPLGDGGSTTGAGFSDLQVSGDGTLVGAGPSLSR